MTRRSMPRLLLFAVMTLAVLVAGGLTASGIPRNAAGMAAKGVCSAAFVAHRPAASLMAQDVLPASAVLRVIDVSIDEPARRVSARFAGLFERQAQWLPQRGCVLDVAASPARRCPYPSPHPPTPARLAAGRGRPAAGPVGAGCRQPRARLAGRQRLRRRRRPAGGQCTGRCRDPQGPCTGVADGTRIRHRHAAARLVDDQDRAGHAQLQAGARDAGLSFDAAGGRCHCRPPRARLARRMACRRAAQHPGLGPAVHARWPGQPGGIPALGVGTAHVVGCGRRAGVCGRGRCRCHAGDHAGVI